MGRKGPGDRYKWAGQPPPRKRQEIPIVRVRAGREIQCVCLSEEIEGLLVHFLSGRTRACVGSNQSCEGCVQGWAPRWKGYLACFFPHQSQRVYLVELTERAFQTLEASAPDVNDYRCRWISVRRDPGRPNAKITAAVMGRPLFDGKVPELPDVRAAIAWILEAPDRKLPVDPSAENYTTNEEKG